MTIFQVYLIVNYRHKGIYTHTGEDPDDLGFPLGTAGVALGRVDEEDTDDHQEEDAKGVDPIAAGLIGSINEG